MIRIAYIVSTLRRAGPTNQLLNIISNLGDEFSPYIITLSPEPADSMLDEYHKRGFEITSLGLSRIKGLLFAKRELLKLLDTIKPDIIHTQGIRPDMLSTSIKNIPLVTTIRNDPFVDYPSKFGKTRGKIMARKHLGLMRKGRNVYACAASLAGEIEKKYGLSLKHVANGVDSEKYMPPSKKEREDLRKQLGLDINQQIILSVGGLISRKDNNTTVEGLVASDTQAELIILGKGPEYDKLKSAAEGKINLKMPGLVDNVMDYLKAANLFISSSIGEGLPNTVLEAMACGLPVILSDIPSHREIFHDHDYKYFFNTGDAHQLSKLIDAYFMDNDEKLNIFMRKVIEASYSAKIMSHSYREIYKSLVK